MLTSHAVILKANRGELKALAHLDSRTALKVRPLFEIGRLTDAISKRKYIQESSAPTMTHLNRMLNAVGETWSSRTAMVDGYHWPANAHAENGDHVIAYMVDGLRTRGISVIPVIGYDRWNNAAYKLGLKAIPARDDGHYCLRLDSFAIEDASEPEHFYETISDIIDELELNPDQCSVLVDFADISMDAMPIEAVVTTCTDVIQQMQAFGFGQYIVAGCSLPRSIDLAVSNRDSHGMLLRKEMLVWQTLRQSLPDAQIVSGDYGVRGPTTTEIPSKYINGKIRYTTKRQTFIVRGHAFCDDHSNVQMQELAQAVVESSHFLGKGFSWGDDQVSLCSTEGAFGNPSDWIAIDTNHHLAFVVQEVDEFERSVVVKTVVERT